MHLQLEVFIELLKLKSNTEQTVIINKLHNTIIHVYYNKYA